VYSITVVPLPSYSALSRDKSGASAVIAIRAWYRPQVRVSGGAAQISARLGSLPVIAAEGQNRHAAEILRQMPTVCLHGLIFLIGIWLVFLLLWSHRKELGLFAFFLISNASIYLLSSPASVNSLPTSLLAYTTLNAVVLGLAYPGVVEFARIVFDIPGRTFRLAGHVFWIVPLAAHPLYALSIQPSALIPFLMQTARWAIVAWELLIILACLFTLYRRQRNGLIALAMMLVAIILFLTDRRQERSRRRRDRCSSGWRVVLWPG
jgi:hypothetical protein